MLLDGGKGLDQHVRKAFRDRALVQRVCARVLVKGYAQEILTIRFGRQFWEVNQIGTTWEY